MELGGESVAVSTDLDSGNLETINSNGNCKDEERIDDNSLQNNLNSTSTDKLSCSVPAADVVGAADAVNTETDVAKPSSTPPKKGYGLKKWRRIPRNDHVGAVKTDAKMDTKKEKEKEYDSDSTGRMLKRGSVSLLTRNEEEKEKENGGSSNSAKTSNNNNNPAAAASNAFVVTATPTFNAGVDSDNSDGSHNNLSAHSHRSSSKSSTAATTKLRSCSKHRSQSAKPQSHVVSVDASKKSKGGLELDFERENSPISSMGSDSICSNTVFFRGSCDRASNSLPHQLPDSSDQAQHSPPASTADAAPHSPDSSVQLSSSAANVKDHQIPGDGGGDPLVESILVLQSAQLALQAEVQKVGEIGKGICSLCDDSDKTNGIRVSTMSVDSGLYMDRTFDGLSEFNHAYLSNRIQTLEMQLDEAKGNLQEKELRIGEYETTMRSSQSFQDLATSALEQQYRKCTELEDEVQDLFKQKLEAEVQSVVITRSTKDSVVLVKDWIKLMQEQKSVTKEQTQSSKMGVDLENKATMQQGQAEKLDTHMVDSEEILKIQRGVVKLRKSLFIQLVLLGFVFVLFVKQLGPKSTVVVPT